MQPAFHGGEMSARSRKKNTHHDAKPVEAGWSPRSVVDSPWFWPAVIFACALLLRVIYTLEIRYTPFFQTLGLDAKYYDRWAREIAGGTAPREAFFMTPLYPYFLAAIYRLFGRDLLLIRMIQAGLGSLSAVLVYLLGKEVFDRKVGILAGLVAAAYGALIFYDGSIILTPLLVLLNLVALFLLVRADATGKPQLYALSGVALGLSAIGRAAVLVFVPAALLWVWFGPGRRTRRDGETAGKRRDEGGRRPARPGGRRLVTSGRWSPAVAAGLLLLGVLVVLMPVTIRNFVVSRDFVLVTSNGGLNFYIGNSEISSGSYALPPGLDIVNDPDGKTLAEEALGRELAPSEVSSYWYGRARAFISENPGRWMKLLVRKLSWATSSYELPQLENYYFQSRYSRLLSFPLPGFAFLAPLGLLGLGLTLRRRRSFLLSLFFAIYVLSVVAFFVLARYRLPAVPVLIIGASYAVFEFVRLVRGGEWRSLVVPVVALVVLGFVVNTNFYGVDRGKGFAQSHYRLGIIYGERGDTERAIMEYRRSISIDPFYPKSYLNLGALLADSGEGEEAVEMFRNAVRLDPGYAAARVNLAIAHERVGDYDAAMAQLDTLLAGEPENAMALKERGIVFYRTGRPEEAVAAFEEAARHDADGRERPEIEFYLGLIARPGRAEVPPAAARAMARADSLTLAGRPVEAVAEYEDAARLAPASGEPLRRLAMLKRDMALLDEALDLMGRALRMEPTLDHGHFMTGVILSEMGRHDDAIREYESELRIDRDFAPAHLNLALTYQFHAGNPNLAAYHYRRHLDLGGERIEAIDSLVRELEASAP